MYSILFRQASSLLLVIVVGSTGNENDVLFGNSDFVADVCVRCFAAVSPLARIGGFSCHTI